MYALIFFVNLINDMIYNFVQLSGSRFRALDREGEPGFIHFDSLTV